jgi:hypothetical protein
LADTITSFMNNLGLRVFASLYHQPNDIRVGKDIVLRGVNVEIPNYLEDSPGLILTGAFVPFGTETKPDQVIKGRNKCGGSILVLLA